MTDNKVMSILAQAKELAQRYRGPASLRPGVAHAPSAFANVGAANDLRNKGLASTVRPPAAQHTKNSL